VICYKKEDLVGLKNDDNYYMPSALFDTMQYKLIRLEVKWAYVACLNVLIKSPSYDQQGNAYLKDDHPQVIEVLATLANKKVDQDKVAGYMDEMEESGLIERQGRNVYLKKIVNVF